MKAIKSYYFCFKLTDDDVVFIIAYLEKKKENVEN